MSLVNMSQAGAAAQPSPSIWKDCPLHRLTLEGTGYFIHEEFLGMALDGTDKTGFGGNLSLLTTGTTVLTRKAGKLGGYLNMATGGSDNDAAVLISGQMASIVLNSGNKVWFEVRMQAGVADKGIFLGLIEEAGQTEGAVADNGVTLIGESLIGFQVSSGATSTIDAVMKLDAGTVVKMKAAAGTLVADTEIKLGFKFDGKKHIEIYVDGAKVSSYEISSATFPVGVKMGLVLAVKTGTATTNDLVLDWVRAAYQPRR